MAPECCQELEFLPWPASASASTTHGPRPDDAYQLSFDGGSKEWDGSRQKTEVLWDVWLAREMEVNAPMPHPLLPVCALEEQKDRNACIGEKGRGAVNDFPR